MAGYASEDLLINKTQIAVGASETNTVITNPFRASHEDSMAMMVNVVCTSVSVTNAITANLQDSIDGGTTWADVKTVTISADGTFEIEVNAWDGGDTIMHPLLRVTVDSGASDAVDVDNVWVTRRR